MNERTQTIFISPHPDDVALSIDGSILSGYFNRPFQLVTAFSYGGWAPYLNGSLRTEAVSEQRTMEDLAFARAVGASLTQLGFDDAALDCMFGSDFNVQRWVASILRGVVNRGEGRPTWLEVGLSRLADSKIPRWLRWVLMERMGRFDLAYSRLEGTLASIASKSPEATLVCPLGLGLHPDHVLVTIACRQLAKSMHICYYEDLPYARDYSLFSIGRHAARLDPDLRPVLVDVDCQLASKVAQLHLYNSQLGPKDFDKVMSHARRLAPNGKAYERIWRNNEAPPDLLL